LVNRPFAKSDGNATRTPALLKSICDENFIGQLTPVLTAKIRSMVLLQALP